MVLLLSLMMLLNCECRVAFVLFVLSASFFPWASLPFPSTPPLTLTLLFPYVPPSALTDLDLLFVRPAAMDRCLSLSSH